jgi:superfamily I DNA/RNA helicase
MEIQKASGAGLMVIGDDDQDILLWNRKKNQEQNLSSNYYFEKLQGTLQPEVLNLTFNYRSAPEIVAQSQVWINSWLGTERRKAKLCLEANPFASGIVNEFSPNDMASLIREKLQSSKDVAVLCRTNSEVSDLYERLKFLEDDDLCRIKIKQDTGLWLSQTREVAEWLDRCEAHQSFNNSDTLYENYPPDDLIRAYRQLPLPDINSACQQIRHLWDISYQSSGRLTLKSHVEQLKELKLSEASRLIQQREDKAILTISTINSVKGLEFDVVFIYPSQASFPFGASWGVEEENSSSASLEEMAREEKKLYYVAATRAKHELFYHLGDREKSWSQSMRHEGATSSFRLDGTLDEVIISWPGYENQNKARSNIPNYIGTQEYIRRRVQINDSLRIISDQYGRIILSHGNCWIAQLEAQTAKKVRGFHAYGCNLRVSAIYRYPVTEQEIAKENPGRWTYFDKVKKQGWLYTVLVSGRIGEF